MRPLKSVVVPFRRDVAVTEQLSDSALVAACAVGEPVALGALFDRSRVRVFRFVSRLIGSEGPDVDDLVQSTFFEVWRSAARFRGRSSPLTWIFGIAGNLSRHHVRAERRRTSMESVLAARPAAAVPDPGDVAARREALRLMAAALLELPHDLKVAFVLCDLEEVSGVEAAEVLGVRPGTLWRRLHEARVALRQALEGRDR